MYLRQLVTVNNTRYVQKGRTQFEDYGDITLAHWEKFVRQKTTEEALALS